MARRLATIGTALSTLVLPACLAVHTESVPITPPGSRPDMRGLLIPSPAPLPPSEQFAEARAVPAPNPPAGSGFAQTVTAAKNEVKGDSATIVPADHRESEPRKLPVPADAGPTLEPPIAPIPSSQPPIASPNPIVRLDNKLPTPEPVPGADGLIAPKWPEIKTAGSQNAPLVNPGSSTPPVPPMTLPNLQDPLKLPPAPASPPVVAPMAPPPAATLLEPGPSLTIPEVPQTKPFAPVTAAPAIADPAPERKSSEVVTPRLTNYQAKSVAAIDSPLIQAIMAYQTNNPEAAVNYLRGYDPTTQQILISLMPPIVRLAEGKLAEMKPEEMDSLQNEILRIPNMLRTRASLQLNNIQLCREVSQFGHFKPFAARHQYRPGEIAYLYMELANFSCIPDAAGNGFGINLAGSIELRNAAGVMVWRADPKEVPDRVFSIPNDYYRAYRFEVPAVPAGAYSLQVRVVDKPTGREARKTLTFSVAGK